jgi:hypothetical protein
LQSDLSQRNNTPKLVQMDSLVIASFCTQVKGYVGSADHSAAAADMCF